VGLAIDVTSWLKRRAMVEGKGILEIAAGSLSWWVCIMGGEVLDGAGRSFFFVDLPWSKKSRLKLVD
jgi:hypothetical protein